MTASRLAYWHDAAIRRTTDSAASRLSSNPAYDKVLRHSVYGALDFYDAEPNLGGIFQDIGTFGLGALALYLDSTGSITHRRLAELGNTATLMSRGRASAVLGMLRIKGLAHREGSGKQVRYVPSAQLRYFFRARFRIELAALALVEPGVLPVLDRWEEPEVFSRFWAFCGAEMMRSVRTPTDDVKRIESISEHRAGFLILFDLLKRADTGATFPPFEPFEINMTETARRFSISRAHVRRMVERFERDGFLARESNAGTIRFLPDLHTRLRKYIALMHVGILASCYEATRPFK